MHAPCEVGLVPPRGNWVGSVVAARTRADAPGAHDELPDEPYGHADPDKETSPIGTPVIPFDFSDLDGYDRPCRLTQDGDATLGRPEGTTPGQKRLMSRTPTGAKKSKTSGLFHGFVAEAWEARSSSPSVVRSPAAVRFTASFASSSCTPSDLSDGSSGRTAATAFSGPPSRGGCSLIVAEQAGGV